MCLGLRLGLWWPGPARLVHSGWTVAWYLEDIKICGRFWYERFLTFLTYPHSSFWVECWGDRCRAQSMVLVFANASVSDPIAILSMRALATSDSQRGSFGSTTLGCTLAGLGGLLYLFLLLPTWVDRGRGGVGWGGVGWWGGACWRWYEVASDVHATLDIGLGGVGWGMLTLVWSCIGCARYVGHRVGWGGVGWGMLTLVWSCIGCARYVGHRVGWGGVGWGMLTLVWSCIGCARYVGHRVGWGGACWRWFEVASDVHATLDIGLGGVGWGMLTLVWSCIGCARYVGHRVWWGGVGHVDVGLKVHRMCTLRWT